MRVSIVLLLAVGAFAQDKPFQKQADRALAALKANDAAALKALAAEKDLDPWKVADELCFRGEHDAAAAFAKAAARTGTEKLPAYVASRRGKPANVVARNTVAAVDGAATPAEALAIAMKFEPKDDLDSVRVLFGRANVLRAMGRLEEAAKRALACAEAAERIGWIQRASLALKLGGHCAFNHGDWDGAVAAWERSIAYDEARGDKQAVAWALGNMGKAHEVRGRYEEARRCLERSVAINEELRDNAALTIVLVDLAHVCTNLGLHDKAQRTGERSLRLAQAAGNEVGTANALGTLGALHVNVGAYRKAMAYLERAHAIYEKLGNEEGLTACFANMATVYDDLGSNERAIQLYERALTLARKQGDRHRAATILGNLGTVYVRLGAFDRALAYQTEALRAKRELGDRGGEAATLLHIGYVYGNRSAYTTALTYLERAHELAREVGLQGVASAALLQIGGVHAQLGANARAMKCFARALEETKAMGSRAGTAATLSSIGNVCFQLGAFAKALEYQNRALELHEELGHRVGQIANLTTLCQVHERMGNYAPALACVERALKLQRESDDRIGLPNILIQIGGIHQSLGDHAKARVYYERSLKNAEALGHPQFIANALGSLGLLYQVEGDYGKALDYHRRALVVMRELGDRAGVATCLGNMGNAFSSLRSFDESLRYLNESLELEEKLGDRAAVASTLGNIGAVYYDLNRTDDAKRYYERSARAARSLRATPLLVHALTRLAVLHLETKHPARALAAAQRALRDVESLLGGLGEELGASARSRHTDLFEVGALAAVREGDIAEALTFLESGRAGGLLDALGKREALRWKAESLPDELRRLERTAQAARRAARIAYDEAVKAGKRKEIRAATAKLNEAEERVRGAAGRIQRELKQRANLFYPRAETIDTIQDTLAADEAFVVYGICREEVLALVLRRNDERVVTLGTIAGLAPAYDALDAANQKSDSTSALNALRAKLVEPLKLGDDVARLLVSPAGPLCYLPFAALFARPVALTPSGTTHVLLRSEERAKGTGILALGDPDYSGASKGAQAIYYGTRPLAALPGTRKEAATVGTKTLLGANASEAGLRAALTSAKRWRAVHFACHGLVNVERPMLSALALARTGEDDGFLTALEILRTEIPADLAVLSACETGKGKLVRGEGIVGMTRAFMFAGSPRVIVSLWKVDDEATQALMVKFYENWKEHPTSVALKKAQDFVRSHGKWKHPYYWAAWQLWGLPD